MSCLDHHFLMTNNICLKSPPNTITVPPKGLSMLSLFWDAIISRIILSKASKQNLFIIGVSSHMISFAWRSFDLILPSLILQVDSSLMMTNGMENVQWAVRPRGKSREAMPLEATFKTMDPCKRNPADKVFQRNVFLVPP